MLQLSMPLTGRETEVVHGVAQGLSNRQIARSLYLSEKTVKAHLAAVFRKLGAENRVQVAHWAYYTQPAIQLQLAV